VTGIHQPALPDLLVCAHVLADMSAQAILPFFRQPIAVDNKASGGDFDPVTAADHAAERIIAGHLRSHQPGHGMVGEEFGTYQPAARHQWVIDPIDGTRAFIMGSPLWGTLIGLLDAGTPILGVMNQPFTGERFWSDGTGSYMRTPHVPAPSRIKTRSCSTLADATLVTTHPDLLSAGVEQERFGRVKSQARMTRYGGDCYGYCLLAAGFVDVIIETGLKPYDVVALIPIVETAGGRMTTWEGSSAADGGRIVACGDPQLHDTVLKLLAG
jgi:myo-inositol-1(or 4)-monophosphatase